MFNFCCLERIKKKNDNKIKPKGFKSLLSVFLKKIGFME